MLGKYINQFMADNELSVNEEFFIENMDGNRVLIGCADRYKIEDVDGGILTAAVMNEKDKPPAMLLEAALIKSRRKTPAFRHGDISRVLSSCIRHLRVV